MKPWYCPHCGVFKRTKITYGGCMGYSETYHCRCCNTELINVKEELFLRDMEYIEKLSEKNKCETLGKHFKEGFCQGLKGEQKIGFKI